MSLSKITFCILCFTVSTLVSVGQRLPLKYGKVDAKEIALTTYQGADAVILCDYGEYKLDGKTGIVYFDYTRHLRIKILTEAGLRYATQQIQYYNVQAASNYPFNKSFTLQAQTLNVNANGKVIKSKVKSKYTTVSIPDKDFNSTISMHFPNVRPGSIIEYKITIPTIETVNPAPWLVQYDIPSLWNELRIITPEEFNYAIKLYNIDYSNVAEFKNIPTSINYPRRSLVYNANQFQFIRKDIPSLPYNGNNIDYNNSRMFVKFILDFASQKFLFPQMAELFKAMDPEYRFLDKSEKQIAQEHSGYILYKRPDLVKIAKELNKSDKFGIPMTLNMGLNDTIRKLTSLYNTNEEKVMAVYRFVRDQVEWDNQYQIFVDAGIPLFFIKLADKLTTEPVKMNTSLQKVIKKQEGSNSEINAILINLLRTAGFKTYPVLTSTLSSCYLDTAFFNLQQFNHLIAAVEVDGKEILLDAVKKGYGTIMSSDIMNEYGLMIKMQKAQWIQVAYPYPILPRSLELSSTDQTE